MARAKGIKPMAQNKKAFHDYFVEERLECGMELKGTEVKSMRQGRMNLKESFAIVKDGEVLVCGMHISPYEQGNIFNTDPHRARKSCCCTRARFAISRRRSARWAIRSFPLQVYLKDGRFKMELGLCKGKKLHDKRDDMAARDAAARHSARIAFKKPRRRLSFFHSLYGGVLVSTGLWAVR